MNRKQGAILLLVVIPVIGGYAGLVTHGGTTINMDFVDIGYAGNVADSTGYGAVGYNYRIGKFEVTADQWSSVRAADPNIGQASAESGLKPAYHTTWYRAAKFCNWLTTGDAYTGAYQFNGSGTLTNVNRIVAVQAYDTVYVMPSEEEWYKAAYFKPDGSGYTIYASGDSVPTEGVGGENYNNSVVGDFWNVGSGIEENNGTFDMNGNVWEWTESAADGTLDNMGEDRVYRGGGEFADESFLRSSYRNSLTPTFGYQTGFRVVAIPEPSVIALMGIFGSGLWFTRRYFPSV